MDSHEIMSLSEIARRLSEVRRGEEHLRQKLPPDSEWNRTLRLADILAYTGIPYPWILRQFPDMYRQKYQRAPKGPPVALERPADKTEIGERQKDLSRFFYGWDRGSLVKARIGDEWKIVGRSQDQVSLGAAPGAQALAGKVVGEAQRVITMRIDRETLGLRFK